MEETETENLNEETNNTKRFKKKIRVSSDAFPPKHAFESKKIQPAYSDIHKYLKDEKIQIEIGMVKLRKIKKEDLTQIKPLFKEWFPLDYDEQFYEKIFSRLEEDTGISLVAYIENPKSKSDFSNLKTQKNQSKNENENEKVENLTFLTELIIGLIITNKVSLENYIARVPYRYENLGYLDEICFNTKYFVYVQSLGVIDECRRLKLGTLLLDEIIKIHNKDFHCLGIYLHVVVYNAAAIKFYEKNGFKEMNHLYNYYFINDTYYDSKAMVRLFYKEQKDIGTNFIFRLLEFLLVSPFKILFLIITLFMCCKRYRHLRKLKFKSH